MKEKRQRAIREILSTRSVSTQQELMDALQEKSISATQATLSRDIRELGIVKQQDESGKTRYCLPRQEDVSRLSLPLIVTEAVRSVDCAANIVVVKCRSGMADAACAALDEMALDWVVGTIAGDDTIFILLRTQKQAAGFAAQLRQLLSDKM
ncbi:MAG TPA: arginine repressor [Candidatus Egerieicola faecale]|uniref:Arginine repressor n=1 Tax=Candidatus Egerieicola faecale TaxID=2840774 RepID=A0A9D1IV08_9FIRM|nr:arginine repressor [Candidatus Egerieicola faecale]